MEFETLDSGNRMQFEDGSHRDTQDGKVRPDLIPTEAIRAWGELLSRGAAKYGERNWEKGQTLSRLMASAQRHMLQATEGDTSEDHFAAVLFDVGGIINHLHRMASGDLDRKFCDTPWGAKWVERLEPKPIIQDEVPVTKFPGGSIDLRPLLESLMGAEEELDGGITLFIAMEEGQEGLAELLNAAWDEAPLFDLSGADFGDEEDDDDQDPNEPGQPYVDWLT